MLGIDGSHRVDVCVTVTCFGNGGSAIGTSGSVARGGLALGRGRAALAGCNGVGSALVGLRLVGRSRNSILALRGIAGGRDYLRCRDRLGLRSRLGDNLNGNVRVEDSFRYGVESLRVRMELGFLAVDQGLYSPEVIAGYRCNAKDKRCMHGHGDRLRGCRKSLAVVVQGGVGNINPNVYLAICLRLSSSLVSSSLLGSSLLGGSLIGSSTLSFSCRSCFSFGSRSSLGLIGSLRPIGSLAFRYRLLLSLRLVHLLYGLLRVLRCNGLCQGTGSTRRPHGKDQQRRHCCRNDPLSQGRLHTVPSCFAFASLRHLSTPSNSVGVPTHDKHLYGPTDALNSLYIDRTIRVCILANVRTEKLTSYACTTSTMSI